MLDFSKQRKSTIYFIFSEHNSLIKIGKSLDPRKRFLSLQSMIPTPIKLIAIIPEHYPDSEYQLHTRFRHLRVTGGWFQDSEVIRQYIIKELNKLHRRNIL